MGTAATCWTGYYPSACVEENSSKDFHGADSEQNKNMELKVLPFVPQDVLTK